MFEIRNKVAIVTGGADGIGLATVEALLRKGAKVILSDINKEKLHNEATRLSVEFHDDVTYKVTDVSDEEQVKELVQFAVDTYGHLDIMVANAGIGFGGDSLTTPTDMYKKVIDVNQHGVFYSSMEAIKQMVKQGTGGAVVNVSSILGIVGQSGALYYNASKGAVRLMTKSMALEFAKFNIRVNSVHPGYIITGMVNDDVMGEEGINALKMLHPLAQGIGRLGAPEEISSAILLAIENTFMTGSEIVVDGGYTAQ